MLLWKCVKDAHVAVLTDRQVLLVHRYGTHARTPGMALGAYKYQGQYACKYQGQLLLAQDSQVPLQAATRCVVSAYVIVYRLL